MPPCPWWREIMPNSLPTSLSTHIGIVATSISRSVNLIVLSLLKNCAFYIDAIAGNSFELLFFLCLSMCPSICLCISGGWVGRLHKNCSRSGFISHLPRMHLWWDRTALKPEARTKEGQLFHSTSPLLAFYVFQGPRRGCRSRFSLLFFFFFTLSKMCLFYDTGLWNALSNMHKRTVYMWLW